MSNYICLADILSSGGGIEVDVALVGDVSTSEIRYYREGDESNVVSPNSAQVYLSKYGTYYFYLTNGDRTSGKVKVEATQAMLYSISLGYFSTTVNITCTGPESGADITLSGPNS